MSRKFTDDQVKEIYHSNESVDVLAERYNVSRYNIITIKRKIYYRNITEDIKALPGYCPDDTGSGKTRPLPIDIIKEIYKDSGDFKYFEDEYGASEKVVRGIKSKKSFNKYTDDLGEPGQVKRHKLTNNDIVDIRNDFRPNKEIAEEYGIHLNTVRNIKDRKTRIQIWDEF